MSRIKKKFEELQLKKEKALIAYVMAGYPTKKDSVACVRGLIKGGADIIEIGFPFSDPIADGPIIQNASTVSLDKGTNIKNYLNLVRKIREETEIPLVSMTYTNILYHKGYKKFIEASKKVGIDGFILPDMSIEESKEYLKAARKEGIDTIFLVSPNTRKERIKKISKDSTGFLYLVAVYGTTGLKTGIKNYTLKAIKDIKRMVESKTPLGVGFGVSSPKDVKTYVRAGADAVIVGSAYLKLIKNNRKDCLEEKIAKFTKSLKSATKL